MENDPKAHPVAKAFASALVEGRYQDAHEMLTSAMKQEWPPEILKREIETLGTWEGEGGAYFSGCDDGIRLDDWPAKQDADLVWSYVSIYGESKAKDGSWISEGVTVILSLEGGVPKISSLEWGRP